MESQGLITEFSVVRIILIKVILMLYRITDLGDYKALSYFIVFCKVKFYG